MLGKTALTTNFIFLLVSACIQVKFNVNIVPEADQTPESTTPIPSPASGSDIKPTTTLFMPALTPPDLPPPPGGFGDQNRAVEAARHHLAGVLDVPIDQISLLQVESQTWRDTSLGCPQPGRGYAQVLTPGFFILLEYYGQRYELHSDQSGASVILCHVPARKDRIPLRGMLSQAEIVERARGHLAGLLSVPLESVVTISVEPVEWDDPSLGCGYQSGMRPDRANPGGIPGLHILLEADGQRYEYHSGGLWLVFCGPEGSSYQEPKSQ